MNKQREEKGKKRIGLNLIVLLVILLVCLPINSIFNCKGIITLSTSGILETNNQAESFALNGSLPYNLASEAVAIRDQFLYVSNGTNMLVFDVSKNNNEKIVFKYHLENYLFDGFPTERHIERIQLFDNYTFLVVRYFHQFFTWQHELVILDITTPNSPVFIDVFEVDYHFNDLFYDNNILYVLHRNQFEMYNLTSVGSPVPVTDYFETKTYTQFKVINDYLYLYNYSKMVLEIYDITTKTNPVFKNEVQIPINSDLLMITLDTQHLCFLGSNATVYSLENPNEPVKISQLDRDFNEVRNYCLSNDNCYIITFIESTSTNPMEPYSYLQIIDFSNKSKPSIVDKIKVDYSCWDVAVYNNRAYITVGRDGLFVFVDIFVNNIGSSFLVPSFVGIIVFVGLLYLRLFKKRRET